MVNIEYFANKMKREREARIAPPSPDRTIKPPSRQCSAHPGLQANPGASLGEMPPAT